ncbi:S-layer homology domain-containing protein [Paenibacillus sepulcri]|uniref:S-layer homology domain-containing protein n=1 Tax=Paenibacillus sepulcri TaxID=359917 RepID=A0ABS7BX65_9BACL|nr:S-layer homology domain-containing protein [Paenibacillus sepulcri]
MKRSLVMLSVVVLLLFAATQSVWAFSDTKNDPNESKIADLQSKGILSGGKDGLFKPGNNLTYAEGVSLIVKGLALNIDTIRFVKAPKASDYYSKAKDGSWYEDAFIIAQFNGINLPKDVDPNAVMTREQFAYHLFQGIMKTGDYAFIDIYAMINDEADINKDYMSNIQRLLIAKIVQLDSKQNFYPQKAITRGEAAGWLYNSIQFVEEQANNTVPPVEEPTPSPLSDVIISTVAVNDKVNEVTVSAMAPNPGYGLKISSISFDGDKAVVQVEATYPEGDQVYPQVITEVKSVTYVSSAYTPTLADAPGSAGGSDGSVGSSTGIMHGDSSQLDPGDSVSPQ